MAWDKRLAREGIVYKTHSPLVKLRPWRARGIDRMFEPKAVHRFSLWLLDRWPRAVVISFDAHRYDLIRLLVVSQQLHGCCVMI